MAKVRFKVNCIAHYESELELPESVDPKEVPDVIFFIRDNLHLCNIKEGTLEFDSDLQMLYEAVEEDAIIEICEE